MGRRGPPPKPAKLRLVEGARPDRVNQSEPVASSARPECPEAASAEVREVWDYTVAELDQMGLASAADRDALLCYCEAVVAHRKASVLLAKSDVLIKGIHGNPVRNPALQVQRDAAQVIRAFAQEFGLTPSARARIEVKANEDAGADNPFASGLG
jgi:P27 family predicted phage terminase small subunit